MLAMGLSPEDFNMSGSQITVSDSRAPEILARDEAHVSYIALSRAALRLQSLSPASALPGSRSASVHQYPPLHQPLHLLGLEPDAHKRVSFCDRKRPVSPPSGLCSVGGNAP